MNADIIKISKTIPRIICVATLFYAALLKLAESGKYLNGFPFKQFFPNEVLIILAALVVSIEICIAYENLFLSENFKREKTILLTLIFGIFMMFSLVRLIPYVNDNYFPHGCACFPGTPVGLLDLDSPIGQVTRNTCLFLLALINMAIVFYCHDKSEGISDKNILST